METELTKRQEDILNGVIKRFIKTAEPVSSQSLSNSNSVKVSPATIRLDFSDLTEKGYLEKSYISGGRAPTDKGYRFFVDKIFEKGRIKDLENYFDLLFESMEDETALYHEISKNLSKLSANLTVMFSEDIVWKEGWEEVIKEPEFKDPLYIKEFARSVLRFEKDLDEFVGEGVNVYIGRESPCGEISVVSGGAGDNFFAILGPRRMDFRKNISLINAVINLFKKV